jgi:hypothetical protein
MAYQSGVALNGPSTKAGSSMEKAKAEQPLGQRDRPAPARVAAWEEAAQEVSALRPRSSLT